MFIYREKTKVFGLIFAMAIISCGPPNHDQDMSYEHVEFYDASNIKFSIETESLKQIEGHSVILAINPELYKINVIEKCSSSDYELSPEVPVTENLSGKKCQQKYQVRIEENQYLCFNLQNRKMRDELDSYENIFSDTSGLVTLDDKENYHLVVFNSDNDEENFFTYFSVENISIIPCDDI